MRPDRLAAKRPRLQVPLTISASSLSPLTRFPLPHVVRVTGSAGAPETHGFEGAPRCVGPGSPISGEDRNLSFCSPLPLSYVTLTLPLSLPPSNIFVLYCKLLCFSLLFLLFWSYE